MKVIKDGKELKKALVRYNAAGNPEAVVPDPSKDKVWQPAAGFEFAENAPETKTVKKTKTVKPKKTK